MSSGSASTLDCSLSTSESRDDCQRVPDLVLIVPFVAAITLAGFMFAYVELCLVRTGIRLADDVGSGWPAVATFWFLAVLAGLSGLRWIALFTLSFAAFCRERQRHDWAPRQWPLVSVFVPAYNEAENIEAALQSLLNLDYPRYEVIVVDDGSTDDTYNRALPFAGNHDRCALHVYRKVNGGKWSAHNFAFRRSAGELVLCLDADSRVEPAALRRMVVHMADPEIAAVAGQIRVRNRTNVLTRLQAMEYLMGNGCARMAMSFNGTVLIVAGPLGLFRRCALEEVFLQFGRAERELKAGQVEGPFEGDTFAEDFDLSMAILSLGGRIRFEPSAVSNTRAPDSVFTLLSQRYRWCRGTIQVLRKYFRRAGASPEIRNPRLIAWLAATYLFDLAILPVVYGCAIGVIYALLTRNVSGVELLGAAGVMLLINMCAAAMFVMIQRDRLGLLHILPLYDLYQSFLLVPGWLISIVDEVRGVSMRW
jgi:cellulose synthase/poly-beta-1,6-N-acetylglucosamine synthase-like glycosyltransferase